MNRIAKFYPVVSIDSNAEFAAEAREQMRKKTGLTVRDVHFFCAAYSEETRLWQIDLSLTPQDRFVWCHKNAATCVDVFRQAMELVRQIGFRGGMSR